MFLLRAFFGLDALAVLFLVVELAIPVLREKPKLPVTKWLLRLLFGGKSKHSLVEQSGQRLKSAKDRLSAAQADLIAAETEQRALRMENQTNELREKGEG